jgi:membrane associated rhomboid family serine protease
VFPSPMTGRRLKRARAKGGSFWYCPETNGRLVTLVMAKHFFGVDGAREIWVRADLSKVHSKLDCSSCGKPMRAVQEPSWLGGNEIDVCRTCHLIWIDGEKHLEQVPASQDFLVPEGDSTVLADAGSSYATTLIKQDELKADREALVGEISNELHVHLRGFMGLPIELHNRPAPQHVWGTGLIAVGIILLQVFISGNPSIIRDYGFYPGEFFKNSGFNIFANVFVHADWFHVLGNAYFFCLFSDDVEQALGFSRYLVFVAFVAVFTAVGAALIGSAPDVPHVGLSGVIMALIVYYALEFPKTRIAYLLPTLGYRMYRTDMFAARAMNGFSWIRLPVWVVLFGYLVLDFCGYYFMERHGYTRTGHSAHLLGAIAGAVFWFLTSKPSKSSSTDLIVRS